MATEKEKSLRGELYHAFVPELVAERQRCAASRHVYNTATNVSRIERINLWMDIVGKPRIPQDTPQDQLDRYAWVEPPFHADYGTNIHLGENVFINFHCTVVDTCKVAIGSRTLLGPSISLYAGTHPLDPWLRDGTRGPEAGAPITIGEDCWLGGCCIVLPGVTIGNGSVVGAGSVVTKDVPPYTVVAGNPARVVRRLRAPGFGREVEEKVEKGEDAGELLVRLERLEREMGEVRRKLKGLTEA